MNDQRAGWHPVGDVQPGAVIIGDLVELHGLVVDGDVERLPGQVDASRDRDRQHDVDGCDHITFQVGEHCAVHRISMPAQDNVAA